PFHFGQRMDASVHNRARLLERIAASDPAVAEAFELGGDVRLATDVWGLFANGAGTHCLPGRLAGLCENGRSSLIGFDQVIVAAGRRDLGFGFPQWELPGVMGVTAAHLLVNRYGAFNGSRLVILGSGAEALSFAELALARGIRITAVIEVAPALRGSETIARRLAEEGVPLLTSTAPVAVEKGMNGEVRGLRIAAIDNDLKPVPGSEKFIACDTVCLGIGIVPNVEALDVLGCDLSYRSELGGHVPVLDASFRTTLDFAYAVGDCAGSFAAKSLDPRIAQTEGRIAALAVALTLGTLDQAEYEKRRAAIGPLATGATDTTAYQMSWLRALATAGGDATLVCQCEAVTRGDLLGVRPPRYLDCRLPRITGRNLETLAGDGPVNQDQVKRLTRAGMGACQGRRCREQVAMLLADASGTELARMPLARYRPPLRPIPLDVLGDIPEHPQMIEHWDLWYAIAGQWTPAWHSEPPEDAGNGVTVHGK
ncbi:MAG: NAD(P)/FAD-dependent oxidoreductase, partial [Betaproteobacteria bacterium]